MFLEGYDIGKYYIILILSIVLTLTVGIKMLNVKNELTSRLLQIFQRSKEVRTRKTTQTWACCDYFGFGMRMDCDQEELDAIQAQPDAETIAACKAIKPHFWFGNPQLLLQACRCSLFLSAVSAAELLFYPWQVARVRACTRVCQQLNCSYIPGRSAHTTRVSSRTMGTPTPRRAGPLLSPS